MKEIFSVWGKTRQIVIIAMTAAVYAGATIPFKFIVLVPGFTELRPGAVIPILFGILFGPAAAWGAGLGNLIADFFGTLSAASIFGFIGNFFFAYTAHLIWKAMIKDAKEAKAGKQIAVFIFASFISSVLCSVIICAGLFILKILPLNVTAGVFIIIIVNNTAMGSILGPPLLKLLYSRVEKTGMLYGGE